MIKILCSLYDEKSQFYGQPILFHNKEDAKRAIASGFSNPACMYISHPEDFKLYDVGAFNDNSGLLISKTPPEFICDVSSLDFRKKESEV